MSRIVPGFSSASSSKLRQGPAHWVASSQEPELTRAGMKQIAEGNISEAGHMQADRCSAETAPPDEAPLARLPALKAALSRMISGAMLPLVNRFARGFVSGETVDDAMTVASRLAGEGVSTTLGFWDTPDYTRQDVAGIYLRAVERLAAAGLDSYVSIKPPALGYDPLVAGRLAAGVTASGIRLHCDSHGPEAAGPSNRMLEAMLGAAPGANLGTAIPGRWLRSLADADWAVERGITVRVVKGQWPDPAAPQRDLRDGFMEVTDRLAGRARRVGVATHDLPLAEQAIALLRARGTSCELEQIYGMSSKRAVQWARERQIGLRLYIPFGKGYIPNALGVLKRNPRLAWVLLKGFAGVR